MEVEEPLSARQVRCFPHRPLGLAWNLHLAKLHLCSVVARCWTVWRTFLSHSPFTDRQADPGRDFDEFFGPVSSGGAMLHALSTGLSKVSLSKS